MIEKKMSESIHEQILKGKEGKSLSIPVTYSSLEEHIDIGKNRYYVIAGMSNSGKSTLAADMFLLNPVKWYLENKHMHDKIKLSVIYFAMERGLNDYVARFLSRLIFLDQGKLIEPKTILSRSSKNILSDKDFELVQHYYKVLDEWEKDDLVCFHSQSKNPTGVAKYIKLFAKDHGTIIYKDKTDSSRENTLEGVTYIPHHPNHIVLIITDHLGIVSPEEGATKQKEIMDRYSRIMQTARDVYGFSPVMVQQMNRAISDVSRAKLGELAPRSSDLEGSSTPYQDSDCTIALFNPFTFITNPNEGDKDSGFELKKLKDEKFRTYYRTLHVLKNTYGSAGFKFPMAMYPIPGIFKAMPSSKEITDAEYENIKNGRYFLQS